MIDKELYAQVDKWFEAHREEMLADIARLVRIASVSDPTSAVKPFGQGCRDCMDEMLQIGREHGFYTENYEYHVGSIGAREKNWDNLIGFWNHMDVVPVGNRADWDFAPFDPIVLENFLIGRGSQDNKGPAIGILYMMQCIRELGIPMKHELALFVGCDEERGMEDLQYYTAKYPTPALSMIADSGFPVCYGEKGIIEGQLADAEPAPDEILGCEGGSASNMIPALVSVRLRYTPELEAELKEKAVSGIDITVNADEILVEAHGIGKHSAFPEGSRNAIYVLADFLQGLTNITPECRSFFERLAYLSEEYYGEHMGITYKDEVSGATTSAATILGMRGRQLTVHLNIRYSITADGNAIVQQLTRRAQELGMQWETERISEPNNFPKEHPAVALLTDLYNEITGDHKESFVMGGGTYARKLPHAFAYGIGGMEETQDDRDRRAKLFRTGHGGAHEPDEGLNLRTYFAAMKIYTMAVIAMNDCPLA